eukprot:Gregarina_sp_Poly_1__8475@NODE_49_length_17731_cov_297_865602_g40_i1_p9_GENE_NODE_49_length_17731_cov_297_865602_g40_i1NODE_49_length_17731_cov_297_865602_g40_i1_p9_ORF_typecomplete_len156_score24_80Clathrin_H_link/PF13838_6/3_4e03Clathrin_H_link/PF13838_6/0_32_NODE_49_length_17731_cov_297_865602_g40_i1956210029
MERWKNVTMYMTTMLKQHEFRQLLRTLDFSNETKEAMAEILLPFVVPKVVKINEALQTEEAKGAAEILASYASGHLCNSKQMEDFITENGLDIIGANHVLFWTLGCPQGIGIRICSEMGQLQDKKESRKRESHATRTGSVNEILFAVAGQIRYIN